MGLSWGLVSGLRKLVTFRRRRAGSGGPATAGAGRDGAALARSAGMMPAAYSLPWQTGRPRSPMTTVADVPRRYAGWVYAAVRAISQGCAACDIGFRASQDLAAPSATPGQSIAGRAGRQATGTGIAAGRGAAAGPRGRTVLSDEHPLTKLFREVNPYHTYRELVEITVTDLELTGNAFWVLARRGLSGVPGEIWPVPPTWMRVVPTSDSTAAPSPGAVSYVLSRGSRKWRLEARDVVHFRYPSPDDPYYGRAPLAAAIEAVYADESLARAQRRTFENGPLPGIVIHTREDLTRQQRERLRAEFDAMFAGPDRAGRLIITGRGASVTPFTTSPREMDFLESAEACRDRILGVFGVPPAVLGLVDDFNRANAEAAQAIFARDTLLPKLKLLAARISQDVCSQFLPDGIECRFDTPVPRDRDSDRRDVETGVRLGILTPNEARADYYAKSPLDGLDNARPVAGAPRSRS